MIFKLATVGPCAVALAALVSLSDASAGVVTTGGGALVIDTARPCQEREGAGMFYAEVRINGETHSACFGVENGRGVVLFKGVRYIAGAGLLKGRQDVEA